MSKTKKYAKPRMSEKNLRKVLEYKNKDIIDKSLFDHIRIAVWLDIFSITKEGSLYLLGYDGVHFYSAKKRNDCVRVRNKLIDTFQRHISKVKEDLDKDWGRRVRERDNNCCIQCGVKKHLTAHHWCRGKDRSRIARWHVGNGVTLCYACHIRFAHERPDWFLYNDYAKYAMNVTMKGHELMDEILKLSLIDARDKDVRKLWYQRGLHDPSGIYAKWKTPRD